jgi:hypothetical protein
MDNSPECRTFLLRRRRTDLEFGWGMYARGSNYVADNNQEYHRWGCWAFCAVQCSAHVRFLLLGLCVRAG